MLTGMSNNRPTPPQIGLPADLAAALADQRQQPVSIGESLGLGPFWKPGRVGWRFARVADGMGRPMNIVVFATEAGTFGVPMTDEDLQRFADQARSAVSGLDVVGAMPPNQPITLGFPG